MSECLNSKNLEDSKGSKALKYRRVVLKLSGESFCAPGQTGIDPGQVKRLAKQLIQVADAEVQLAVVVGGGNILRGASIGGQEGIAPATAHYMGMVATVINGLALGDCLGAMGQDVYLTSSFPVGSFTTTYSRRGASQALATGKIVILSGGTGNPFVTTDTCAAVRAAELSAQALLKATKVDGVYSADPNKEQTAEKFDSMTYDEVIDRRLGIMDLSAIQLCKQCDIPIIVFNFRTGGNILAVVTGQAIGTVVKSQA